MHAESLGTSPAVVIVCGALKFGVWEVLGKDVLSRFLGMVVHIVKESDDMNSMVVGRPVMSSGLGWDAVTVARVGVRGMGLCRS